MFYEASKQVSKWTPLPCYVCIYFEVEQDPNKMATMLSVQFPPVVIKYCMHCIPYTYHAHAYSHVANILHLSLVVSLLLKGSTSRSPNNHKQIITKHTRKNVQIIFQCTPCTFGKQFHIKSPFHIMKGKLIVFLGNVVLGVTFILKKLN